MSLSGNKTSRQSSRNEPQSDDDDEELDPRIQVSTAVSKTTSRVSNCPSPTFWPQNLFQAFVM